MSLVRFAPTRNWVSSYDRFNSMFNEMFSDSRVSDEAAQNLWMPRADIVESENDYRVVVDLPGQV